MDWVKLAVRYWTDRKITALDDAAEVMFTRSVASDWAKSNGGFIPESALPELTRRRRYANTVDSLVANGLWSRVPGGYRITRWTDWQDALDVLEQRRIADRDRKRARRAAERANGAPSPPVRGLSADSPADVRNTEGEKDMGVQVGDRSHRPRAREAPPPKCDTHLDNPKPPPCGACADARRAHERWQGDRGVRLAAAAKCRRHRGQLADNCALCRAERLEAS